MNFTDNLVLKENYTFLVMDQGGGVDGGESGLYNRDTRFLSRYSWKTGAGVRVLLAATPRPDTFVGHAAVMPGPTQELGISRRLELGALGLTDTLGIENPGPESHQLTLELKYGADFRDLFEVRGWADLEPRGLVHLTGAGVRMEHTASDGLQQEVELAFHPVPDRFDGGSAVWHLSLAPATQLSVTVTIRIANPLETESRLPGYAQWKREHVWPGMGTGDAPVVERALTDMRALLLGTDQGPVPAAGIPWFVTAFGRDSLITSSLLLPLVPELAASTLRYLAANRGSRHDRFTEQAPGKILHETRQGELARTGQLPFARYYGTIDATPLFVILLHQAWRQARLPALITELRPAWEEALTWMETDGDPDGDGFLEFRGAEAGMGLSVQSWMDSFDALSHADGRLASGSVAVSEVQGYAYAALRAGADFHAFLGEDKEAARLEERAARLKRRFHDAFWIERLGTYALALDDDKSRLEVQNSNVGHLLWSGIVPAEAASRVVSGMFGQQLWSGWGFRTLGSGEVRYNPLSYHNGSVWPHDTALAAAGLARYGFTDEAKRVHRAILDLAGSQPDLRAPELFAGYAREDGPPVPYPVACRPQAWAAAAVLAAARELHG